MDYELVSTLHGWHYSKSEGRLVNRHKQSEIRPRHALSGLVSQGQWSLSSIILQE